MSKQCRPRQEQTNQSVYLSCNLSLLKAIKFIMITATLLYTCKHVYILWELIWHDKVILTSTYKLSHYKGKS